MEFKWVNRNEILLDGDRILSFQSLTAFFEMESVYWIQLYQSRRISFKSFFKAEPEFDLK